ncbi:MAG: HlyD family efflux transporter periplasmic adaptor subunit, partial [Chloroflexi bacterium]
LPPVPVRLLLVLIIAVGGYYAVRAMQGNDNGALAASGSIEATTVNVSPEMAGKVKEVLASEGQPVKLGDPLLVLDDSLLAAQRGVAQSGVDSARSALLMAQSANDLAQAQYDAALTAARAQEGGQRLADWGKRTPNWFEHPLWYFSQDEQITAVQTEVEASYQALQQTQADLELVIQNLNNADFVAAETRLSNARMGYLIAKSVDDHAQITGGKVSPEDVKVDLRTILPSAYRAKIAIAKDMSGDSDILRVSQDAFDAAEAELDEAERDYKDMLTTEAADRVLKARAELTVAQERYEVALDTLSRLQTGEYSLQVNISAMALEQSKTALKQAGSAIQQAEANLSLLDTQITKLTIYAPMDGVILTRNAEPGEFVQPGGVAFAMADLENITITVYVPEDRYGQISVGQQAQVTVDSFPAETFTAEVIHIADQAEFTPRNVQTVEGRSSTVYAIKLKVTDSEGKLKIGMPADVTFK